MRVPLLAHLWIAAVSQRFVVSLITLGSGASALLNLRGIRQATFFISSAFSCMAISRTKRYRCLLRAGWAVDVAAAALNIQRSRSGQRRT